MRRISFKSVCAFHVFLLGCSMCAQAHAAYIVTFAPDGNGNVVATGSGTIDLDGLSFISPGIAEGELQPSVALEVTGPVMVEPVAVFSGFSGPDSFGSGGTLVQPDSGSGDMVGIAGADGVMALPASYVSGSLLFDTSTYDNTTIAALGLDPGTYVFSWEAVPLVAGTASPDQLPVDTFTVIVSATPVGGSSVPLPRASWPGLLAMAGMAALVKGRKALSVA